MDRRVPTRVRRLLSLLAPAIFLATVAAAGAQGNGSGLPGYVGSDGCQECHEETYRQWSLTPHARMLRDVKKHPDAILADKFNPEIPFTKKDITHVVGSHWVQKFLTTIDGEMYVLPKYWNIPQRDWEPYSIFNWRAKPYSLACYGCHTVGLDIKTKGFTEEAVGCEACHGPGAVHAKSQEAKDIVNPAKIPKDRHDMICESCHTDGMDMIEGIYPFAAGFQPGQHIDQYYTQFFLPKPKSKGWYKGDSTYADRHRMFLFWQTKFYSTIRACDVCGFDRQKEGGTEAWMSRSEFCQTCHFRYYDAMDKHAKHTREQVPNGCTDCHAPLVVAGGTRYSIHDHKFDFSRPEGADIPCAECHDEKTIAKGKPAKHSVFNFKPVEIPRNMTLEEACLRCHPQMTDLKAKMKGLRYRL
jgi:hypothetical protein